MMKFLKILTIVYVLIFSAGTVCADMSDTVTLVINVDPSTINTMETKIGIDLMMLQMHESLLGSDPVTGDLEPELASSLTVMPNGKDIKVKLEKNHLFHNGDPVTAHDVKWTFEESTSPENAHLIASQLEEIESIEVIDDYTLVFHHYEKFAPWKENMWIGICSKNYYEKVGRDKFRTHPIGSGPFLFVSREIGNNIILEASEGYTYDENAYSSDKRKIIKRGIARKKIGFKILKLISVPDPITRITMLEAGEADMIYGLLPQDAKRLELNKKIKVKKSSNVPSYYALAFHPSNYPILKDQKVCSAITHAINRQKIIDKVFLGEGYPLYMYASKIELGYDPSISVEFNLEKARELIKESTYKMGDPIVLTFSNAVPSSVMVATIIQKYLKDIGITVHLQRIEAGLQATYIRNRDKREGHISLYEWGGGRDPQIRLILTLPKDGIYTMYPGRPNQALLDELVLQQSQEMNKNKRLEILKKIHTILDKERSNIALYGLNQIYAMNERIDYSWTPKGGYPYNVERIKIIE